jgi:transposase-like protein
MKLITETDCPHCKKSHEAELDLENFEIPATETPKMKVKSSIPTTQPEMPQPETKIEYRTKIPPHIPKFKCKNCNELHNNPDYRTRPRYKCDNCGSLNAGPYCQTCTKGSEFEELTDEDLDELGIPAPKYEHEHED